MIRRAFRSDAFRRVIASAAKPSKGFGSVRKSGEQKAKPDDDRLNDKMTFKEAASALSTHRPVRSEEAARGKLDYVQVADWGDGDRAKLGELRLVDHVVQYEGSDSNGADGNGASVATSSKNRSGGVQSNSQKPFHLQLAHQLHMAETRGALAVAGPAPPPVSEWSFSERRYLQYLSDLLEVHEALEEALQEATATTSADATASSAPPTTPTLSALHPPSPSPAEPQPVQDALLGLVQLAPGRLGLERSTAIRGDLAALRATAVHPGAVAVAAGSDTVNSKEVATVAATVPLESTAAAAAAEAPKASSSVAGSAVGSHSGDAAADSPVGAVEVLSSTSSSASSAAAVYSNNCTAGPMARSYAHVLRRLGRVAASGPEPQERQGAALRLLAHVAVLHLVAQAAGMRLGATATERLALLQRRAAATYHDYPHQVTDPRVTLSRALDAAGEHVRRPAARQVVFDELASAMQKSGLLMSALAHRD